MIQGLLPKDDSEPFFADLLAPRPSSNYPAHIAIPVRLFLAAVVLIAVGGAVAYHSAAIELADVFGLATALGAGAAAAIGLGALLFAVDQLAHARRTAATSRVMAYFATFNSQDFARQLLMVNYLCEAAKTDPNDAWTQYREHDRTRIAVQRVWNLFEEIGMAYEAGILEENLLRKYLAYASHRTYERMSWVIERQLAFSREQGTHWDGLPAWCGMNVKIPPPEPDAHRNGGTLG